MANISSGLLYVGVGRIDLDKREALGGDPRYLGTKPLPSQGGGFFLFSSSSAQSGVARAHGAIVSKPWHGSRRPEIRLGSSRPLNP
jgi:hypothetical protein